MYKPMAEQRPDRYKVSVDEYKQYQAEGYLCLESLVPLEEVEELKNRAMAILTGEAVVPGIEPPPLGVDGEELLKRFVRVHMLHRNDSMSAAPAHIGCGRGLDRPRCAGAADHAVL